MMKKAMFIVFAVLFAATPLAAQQQPKRPDLIVVISIDQFPYYYLTRFQHYFGDGGFNRFLHDGATFTHALYPYATTYTGPGHASIGTGYPPSKSGIISNTWFDRNERGTMYCVADEHARGGFSPQNLDSDSLGDLVQERYTGSKVFGVALKDRAAILMAGRKATSAYWFDSSIPGFTSSSYYHSNKQLTDDFNRTVPALVKSHPVWEESDFIPAADLERITHDPEKLRKYKTSRDGLGVSFPHPIATAEALTYTPFGNELVIGFAEKLIDTENLGTEDGTPDVLYVGLSSTDYLGHNYGPDSLEAADNVVRVDRQLAAFFHDLDAKFGARYTIALSSDHGVQSIPEVARDMGREAGRLDMRNPNATVHTYGDLGPARRELEMKIAAKLGVKVTAKTPIEKTFIMYFEEPAIYLNWTRIREAGFDGERVKRVVRDAAKELKGVSGAFTNGELLTMNRDVSGLEALVRNSFRADRSGDVLITLKAGYIWGWTSTGTTHGEPVEADQHVPLMFWGDGIRHGTFDGKAAPLDLAKSLGKLLGVDAGDAMTQVLPCIEPAS